MYIELLLFLIDDDYHQHHIYRIIQHKATCSQTMNSFLFVENQFPRFPLVQPNHEKRKCRKKAQLARGVIYKHQNHECKCQRSSQFLPIHNI